MNTQIEIANADLGSEAYLITPEIAGAMAVTPELSNTIALPVYRKGQDGKGQIYGYDTYKSNLLPKTGTKGTGTNLHSGVFGVWSELTIAEFGAMEIILDPYTGARQQLINIIANFLVDSNLTYPQAFTAYTDAVV